MLNVLENFATFSGKPDWLPFLIMYWSCSPHVYLGKRIKFFMDNLNSSRSEMFFKIAVLKDLIKLPGNYHREMLC